MDGGNEVNGDLINSTQSRNYSSHLLLLLLLLGRDPNYLKIVNLFEDNRKSGFSLRQIALMGNSEDKKVGQWFGPNTVAQVLK